MIIYLLLQCRQSTVFRFCVIRFSNGTAVRNITVIGVEDIVSGQSHASPQQTGKQQRRTEHRRNSFHIGFLLLSICFKIHVTHLCRRLYSAKNSRSPRTASFFPQNNMHEKVSASNTSISKSRFEIRSLKFHDAERRQRLNIWFRLHRNPLTAPAMNCLRSVIRTADRGFGQRFTKPRGSGERDPPCLSLNPHLCRQLFRIWICSIPPDILSEALCPPCLPFRFD